MSDHDHDHDEGSHFSDVELRVKALESLLVEKGLVNPETLDKLIDTFETRLGPRNGARVVARAWVDPAYRQRLREDASAAIAELGYSGMQGEHMVVVENTPQVHNVVVCTLCSCYPWPVLGLPPVWYKSNAYRSRVVIDPRGVLKEFGVELPDDVEVRVWDSTAEVRYLVLPERPAGTERMSEQRACSAGHARLDDRDGNSYERCTRHGRHARLRSHRARGRTSRCSTIAGKRARSRCVRPAVHWASGTSTSSRHANERMPPEEYLAATYYERWLAGLQRLLRGERPGYSGRAGQWQERTASARRPGRIPAREGGHGRAHWAQLPRRRARSPPVSRSARG